MFYSSYIYLNVLQKVSSTFAARGEAISFADEGDGEGEYEVLSAQAERKLAAEYSSGLAFVLFIWGRCE